MCTLLSLIIIMMMTTIYMGVKFSEQKRVYCCLLSMLFYESLRERLSITHSRQYNEKHERKLNFVHNKMNVNVQFSVYILASFSHDNVIHTAQQ